MDDTAAALPERKRGFGVKKAYDLLRTEILDLTLPPGSPIDEVQLADRLSLSRTPIREALARLATEGLVHTLPNRSAIVAPIDFLNLAAYFDAITLMYRVTTRLAARNWQPGDMEVITAQQADFAAAVARHDALAMIGTNRDFHATIAQAGRNPYYTAFFTRLLDDGRRLLRLYYQSFDDRPPPLVIDEHEAIIAAIAARDVDAADRLAKAHADQIVGQIQKLLSRDDREVIAL
ncbi:MAG: GntR family transcriptional regulator [Rhodobacteraceae bacterium]|jgi:DNA-binding GntR family transcriptional regulator|nr:GntR family transcriptional regulator [Paracoccaceae bacterium]